MFNYSRIKKYANTAINQLFKDGYTRKVVYKKLTGSSFDPSVGANVNTYENYEIDTMLGDTVLKTSGTSSVLKAIGFSAGERLYIVKYDELPRNPLDQTILKDKIVDNDTEFAIKNATPVFDILVYLQV